MCSCSCYRQNSNGRRFWFTVSSFWIHLFNFFVFSILEEIPSINKRFWFVSGTYLQRLFTVGRHWWQLRRSLNIRTFGTEFLESASSFGVLSSNTKLMFLFDLVTSCYKLTSHKNTSCMSSMTRARFRG